MSGGQGGCAKDAAACSIHLVGAWAYRVGAWQLLVWQEESDGNKAWLMAKAAGQLVLRV